MSMTLDLSATLRGKLASVARRIRLLRAVRGSALLLLTLAVTAGLALLADYAFTLPPVIRGALLALWAGLGGFVALFGLVLPVQRSLDPAALAAVIEEKYPDLGERLTSSVELSATPDSYHGSPALIALLLEETEVRTRPLDFLCTVSSRRPLQVAATAAVALLLAVVPAFVWPEQVRELGGRFLFPWRVPPVVIPYSVTADTGDGFVKQGDPFTIAARLVPNHEDVRLPATCTLVVTDTKTDETQRFRMLVDSPTAFSYRIERVGNSFRYHVEAGDAQSAEHSVTAVVPVKLASTAITPIAPAYAQKAKYTDKPADGIVDLTALQHSRVRFDLRFTRDAVHAALLLTPIATKPAAPARATIVPLELTADRTAAKGEFTLTADVTAQFVLEAEHRIQSQYGPVILLARKDTGPSIAFKGKDDLPPVSVNDRVPMPFTVEDDIAVSSAAIEYRINRGKVVAEPVKLDRAGMRNAESKHEFAISGKAKHGDIVEYRIAATDNRDVPEANPPLTPQTTHYPPEGWLTLRVVSNVRPLNERDIIAQRDDINQRIEKIKENLRIEKRQAYRVQQESRNDDRLSDEHQEHLAQVRKDNQQSRQDLADIVRDYGATPGLDSIARTADEVAEGELRRTQNDLDAAKSAKQPKQRYDEFNKADKELDSALRKLDALQKENQKLAQQRLDQMRLDNLARQQQKLAEKAAELAAKDPIRDPAVRQQMPEIQREQNEVAAELQRLADQSEELRKSLDAARAEQAKELAEKARELAQAQRDLAQASNETEKKRQAERLSDLARRQQELAKKADELARDTKQPTQTARVAPLKPDEATKAAKALEEGDASKALQHQDKSALELDRLTADLDRALKLSDDPREAARQLARLEEAMKKRVADEARKPATPARADRLKPLQQEQQAVAEAARQLSVPATSKEAEKAREQASRAAAQAAEDLKKQDPAAAQQHIEQAKKALERLAYELPDLNKRRQEAQAEVERLRRQQDEIARQAEQAARQAKDNPDSAKEKAELARKLQDAAKRQAEAAERLSKTDPAAQDERKERAERALNRALADLLDGRKDDVPASQQEAKRELQRLAQALAGQKPADEKAQELARRQQDLADQAAKLADDPKATPQQKAELQRQQQQVAQETQGLDAPEAPQRKAEAAQAAKQAEQAANAQPTGEQTRKKMEEAAQALQRLADQMKGRESEPARAERLARQQAEAAAEADRRARQSQQPAEEQRQRQQQIAEEAKQLRGGEEGQAEKRRAQQALDRTQQGTPREMAKAQRQAADALRDLADKMAGRTDPAAKAQELARQQRELAREAQRPEPAAPARADEALRRAQQQQQELNRQLGRLDRQGAAEERKQAEQKMAEARKALDDARTPADAKPQLERAAQAAEDLARKLGQEQAAQQPMGKQGEQTVAKPSDQSPQRMAQQAAQQQRELARATQEARRQAERQGGEQGKQNLQKAMERIGQEQQKLNQQASQLPANQNQKALEQARQAMNEARRSLAKNDAAQAQRRQEDAARALQDLARQLPQQQSAQAGAPATAGRPQQGEQQASRPQGLPSRQQAEQARQLAQQQRDIRRDVEAAQRELARQPDTPMKSAAQELARQQQEIARQAGELARNVGKEQGQQAQSTQQARQAQQSTQQAANRMQAGALPQAQQAGQQAAQQLRQLAQQLGQTPRSDKADPKAPDPFDQARRLAQQQDELNRRMQPLAQDASAQRGQQQARQQDLQRQTGDLTQELSRLAQQSGARNPQGAQQAQQAAQSSQQAQQAMQQAQQQAQQGNQGQSQQQQQQAAQALDRAAQQASQAARQMASAQQPGSPQQAQAGQSVQQAQRQMGQAQSQLNQGQNQSAQSSMQQAAQSLQQASQALAQSQQQQPGQPSQTNQRPTVGAANGGLPDLSRYGEEGRKYQGKTWGQLPGSLQTRIIQDLKDQFGDDYARRIKLYFEQVSNTRKP